MWTILLNGEVFLSVMTFVNWGLNIFNEMRSRLVATVSIMGHLHNIWRERNIFIVLLTPLLLLPLVLTTTSEETKCAYVVCVMALLWVTEAFPIAVTSFLPIFMFPMVGLMSAKDVSSAYVNDTSMLFLGGLLFAAAIEHWDIHKRFALRVLTITGAEPQRLLLGMMLPTWFLSMWISNTATTAMMMPIANAVAMQLKEAKAKQREKCVKELDSKENSDAILSGNGTNQADYGTISDGTKSIHCAEIQVTEKFLHDEESNAENPEHQRINKALSLAIAYAANIGGIATLTGTIPNVVMKGQSEIVFQDYGGESPITFATWMQFGLPVSAVIVIFLWLWFLLYFLRCRVFKCCSKNHKDEYIERVTFLIREEYNKIGPVTFAQGAVIGHFLLLGILWITRDLGGVGGWGSLFPKNTVTDSTPSILMSVSLFVFPSELPKLCGNGIYRKSKPLLPWKVAEKTVPWGVIILLGGGFALARASQVSGLSSWLGYQLTLFNNFEPWVMNLILCYAIAAATEVTSNAAICTLMMPILAELALNLGVNPLYLMFPTAIATSFAFMLPVATPPNAVVFSYGYVRVVDMMMAGFSMNLISVPLLVALTELIAVPVFDLHKLPSIFVNNTLSNVHNFSVAV